MQSDQAMSETDRRNRDLVRSLDKRQGDQGGRRKRRRRRRRQRSDSGRGLTKEERRKLRREQRRHEKQRAKDAIRERRRRERKSLKLRHGRAGMSDYSPVSSQQKSLSVRSIQMRTAPASNVKCPQKHVDTCSWPQCNRSCPKLHNPLTGMHTFEKVKRLYKLY